MPENVRDHKCSSGCRSLSESSASLSDAGTRSKKFSNAPDSSRAPDRKQNARCAKGRRLVQELGQLPVRCQLSVVRCPKLVKCPSAARHLSASLSCNETATDN